MGSSTSIKAITLHSEPKAGDFLILNDVTYWTFKWGNIVAGIEVLVRKQGQGLSAHLLRNNMMLDSTKHFDVEKQDGYMDVVIRSGVLEILDVHMKCRGICSMSLEKVMFAAIRIYARDFRRTVRWGCVNITSKQGRAAYRCYVEAFRRNGFCTETSIPETEVQEDFMLDFVKTIRQPLNMGPLQRSSSLHF